jgi:hypothetical protein
VFSLNSCADVDAWQAAGFAPGSEPAGTKLAGMWQNVPAPSPPDVLYYILTIRQRRAIDRLQNKAFHHATDLGRLVQSSFESWISQNGA